MMMKAKDNKSILELQNRIENLERNTASLLERLKMARLDGDISENADFTSIKEEYENSQKLIFVLKGFLLQKKQQKENKNFFVTYLRNQKEKTMELVEEWEADPEKGRLSINSPLGQTLLQGKENEDYLVTTEKMSYWITIIQKNYN